MTTAPIAESNDVLAILAAAAEDETWDTHKDLVSELDQRTSVERAKGLLARADRAEPVGVFVGSTVRAQEYIADLEDAPAIDDWPAVWKTLKTHGRIVQVGRGRGQLVMVIDDTPIASDETPRVAAPMPGTRPRGRPAKASTPTKKAAKRRGRPPVQTPAQLALQPRAEGRPTEQFANAFMALLEVAMTPLRDELAELRQELDRLSEAMAVSTSSSSPTTSWS